MATDYNILIKRFNGSDWDSFYPQSWKLIKSGVFEVVPNNISNISVTTGNYYGKVLALEIAVIPVYSNAVNKTVIFVTLGTNTHTNTSFDETRNNASFTSFDGQYLNTISFRVRALNSSVSYIFVENLKSLSGSFSGSQISWLTSQHYVYVSRIWLVQ